MEIINEVDKPGSEIEFYVKNLDKILDVKENRINEILTSLRAFKKLLSDEELISQKFFKAQQEIQENFDDNL